MSTVQLTGSIISDSQIKMNTGTEKEDVSLAKEFQEHLKKALQIWCHLSRKIKKNIHGKKRDRQKVSCSG